MKALKEYIGSLFEPQFRLTGLKTAIAVGCALFCINHGAAFLRGQMNRERWISAFLTYLVPYLVNVHGQYSYRRKLLKTQPSHEKLY